MQTFLRHLAILLLKLFFFFKKKNLSKRRICAQTRCADSIQSSLQQVFHKRAVLWWLMPNAWHDSPNGWIRCDGGGSTRCRRSNSRRRKSETGPKDNFLQRHGMRFVGECVVVQLTSFPRCRPGGWQLELKGSIASQQGLRKLECGIIW
jgi:hypothetical protein